MGSEALCFEVVRLSVRMCGPRLSHFPTLRAVLLKMNQVLYGMSQVNIDKLQRAQNILTRVVVGALRTSSSLNVLRNFYWLPVGHRIIYRLCLTTWKTLNTFQRPDPCVLPIQISPSQTTRYY